VHGLRIGSGRSKRFEPPETDGWMLDVTSDGALTLVLAADDEELAVVKAFEEAEPTRDNGVTGVFDGRPDEGLSIGCCRRCNATCPRS
jgi:hypothetical protein